MLLISFRQLMCISMADPIACAVIGSEYYQGTYTYTIEISSYIKKSGDLEAVTI